MPTDNTPAGTQLRVREAGYRQGTRAVVPEGSGQKIKVRLMGWEPGTKVVEGSSADYPVDRIVRDFPESFPVGTRMRANHDGFCEAGGDIRRVMAKTTSDPWQEEDGMYAWAVAREGEASEFLRQFADVIGTSVSVAAEVEMEAAVDSNGKPILDENNQPVMTPRLSERGAQIVERFLPMSESPYNAVDFVEAPGADGAIVALATESAKDLVEKTMLREASSFAIDLAGKREKTSAANRPGTTQQEDHMLDLEQIKAAVAATIAEALKPINTFLADEGARRQAEAEAQAGADGVKEAREAAVTAVEAVKAAKLPESVEADLLAQLKEGADISKDLAFAQKVLEAKPSKSESTDSFITHESAAGDGESFSLGLGGSR
jgi:hypothetical protein